MVLNQFLVMQLLFVILHVVALILSLVYWRRCPTACSLLLSASIMNLIAALGRIGLPFFLLRGEAPFFNTVMIGLTVLNWLGYGLMLMAVFAGRNEPTHLPPRSPRLHEDDDDDWHAPAPGPPKDDDDWHRPAPKPPTPPSTGIQA